MLSACALLTGASILALWLPFSYHPASSHAGIIVFTLVYGFVSGAFVCLLMPCAAKSGSLDTLGQRFGTFQMVVALRSVALPPCAFPSVCYQDPPINPLRGRYLTS